jgi:hypothetical protein
LLLYLATIQIRENTYAGSLVLYHFLTWKDSESKFRTEKTLDQYKLLLIYTMIRFEKKEGTEMANTDKAKAKAKDKSKKVSAIPAKLETKNDLRVATAQLMKTIKGIDNDVVSVNKLRDNFFKSADGLKEKAVQAQTLAMAISNKSFELHTSNEVAEKALKTATKLAASTAAKAPAKAPTKPTKAEAKPAKVKAEAKPAKAKEAKAKPAKAKETKTVSGSVDNRPQLKAVIKTALESASNPLTAAEIFQAAKSVADKDGFKVWSRQSLYNQLEDRKSFSKDGDKDKAVYTIASSLVEEDVENFLKKTASSSASVSAVI